MSQRFFVESPIAGETATLVETEAHHLLHVMRAKVGTEVTLFDGSGCEFPARVVKLARQFVDLEVLERREANRELPHSIALAVSLPKGDRQKWLVEKATELGVSQLIPLQTDRGVAQPEEQALVRLRRSVIEASKQCGRNLLMEISEPLAWPELAKRAAAQDMLRIMAHPGGHLLRDLAAAEKQSGGLSDKTSAAHGGDPLEINAFERHAAAFIAAIGPEGGFSPAEVELAISNGWQRVGLGQSILRIETAALAIAAWAALEFQL